MVFNDLPRPMRFIVSKEDTNMLPPGYLLTCLGDIPEGYRELTDEEKKKYFGE